MAKPDYKALIAEGASLKSRIETDSKRLKEIGAEIVTLGPGKHEGNNATSCSVIEAAATIKPGADAINSIKELVGDNFGKLFDRAVSFKPVKSFREVLSALVTPAKARKVIALAEVASAPYVKW